MFLCVLKFLDKGAENIMKSIRFVDLFAGIGGIRKGFELACADKDIMSECVFTSEIKSSAINILHITAKLPK